MKLNKLILIFVAVSVLILSILIISKSTTAFQGTSASYTMDSKPDVVAHTNATSTNFIQRFIGGIQAVARYVSSLFTGRFGILEEGTMTLNISSCQTFNIANSVYILNQSVNSSATCFIVNATNVTLDCNYFNITYAQTANGYGVSGVGVNESKVINCKIYQLSTSRSNSYALYFKDGEKSSFINNTILTYGSATSNARNYGIYLLTHSNSSLDKNNVTTNGKQSYAIYLNTN